MIGRIGTDPDGFPVYGDAFGRTVAEIADHEHSLIQQAYVLTNRSLMESMRYWSARQIGVDSDGFPVYGRPWGS